MSALIKMNDLTKIFMSGRHEIIAVDKLNLAIEEGEVYGFLGPNGAGKTTTIKMLSTLLEPTAGSAQVNGYDIIKQPSKVRESIGIVFQDPSSDELLTGYENLKLSALMYNVRPADVEKRIDFAFELVELTERKDDLVKTYSGGMRRRLEIARALLHKPKILFLDEPTLGLDPRGRETIWKYIERLRNEYQMTILLTTHYMEEADTFADRICIIDHGRAVAIDTPEKLKRRVGGDIITIVADSPRVDKIKNLKWVKKIERKNGKLLVMVDNAAAHIQALLNKIGKVECVEVRRPTLDDVFIKFTGRRLEEEQAEGGFFEKVIMVQSRQS
jgi:ABC-2 type transport system ATP-binding protein